MKRSDRDPVVVAFGLGGNLEDREQLLCLGARTLSDALLDVSLSSPYTAAPRYELSQPAFLNAALVGFSHLEPEDLLGLTKAIELAAGRRQGRRYGPRLLDIDLLVYGDTCLNRPELTLPHPRLREREFVLAPLAEIAPGLEIPPDGSTAADLLAAVKGLQGVKKTEWSLRCRKLLP